MATSKTDLLTTHKNELVKQYVEFDGSNRISKVYTAYTDATHGAPCEVTEYIYVGVSTTLRARKEGRGVWDSAWDADFTVDT